jgi:hypothetical protein
MKLSEYIFKEYNKGSSALSEDDIERWIVEWYRDSFKEVGCKEVVAKRQPPTWLADWRKIEDG